MEEGAEQNGEELGNQSPPPSQLVTTGDNKPTAPEVEIRFV